MSEATPRTRDEIDDLLVRRATEGLDAQDQQHYDALVASDPTIAEAALAFELAAASADVALQARTGLVAALPAELRGRLLTDAETRTGTTAQAPTLKLTDADPPAKPTSSPMFSRAALGWYVAAAAAVAFMFVLSRNAPSPSDNPTPAQQYATLKAEPATVNAAWNFNPEGGDPRYANASGEVIFNAQTQTGYMKLTGLPVNDPSVEQYQLWIVDATRSGSENTDRVDGGVFNVTANGEVLIPIDAKLDARQPIVFAITVEKPGGVVESKGPLHVVAAVAAVE